ncbi:MAG TPA: type II secretion system protein GspM [Gemmatimonadales bacterium]|jgi:hypothetical protein|nr:type II secretion system protein GspM [Gemmatimonadales bacterium]
MTARDRRALLLGAAVVGAAVLGLRVLPWAVRSAAGAYAELRERAALLARAREELAGVAVLRDSTAVLTRAVVALAPQILEGGSAADAGADLSGTVSLAATRAPAKLERLDALPDSTGAGGGRLGCVRVHVALETDVRGLAAFLKAIDDGDAVLAVEDLRVVAPDPGSADRIPEILKVEVTVSGWYLKARETGNGKRET